MAVIERKWKKNQNEDIVKQSETLAVTVIDHPNSIKYQ